VQQVYYLALRGRVHVSSVQRRQDVLLLAANKQLLEAASHQLEQRINRVFAVRIQAAAHCWKCALLGLFLQDDTSYDLLFRTFHVKLIQHV
jgi:hypothetical protein